MPEPQSSSPPPLLGRQSSFASPPPLLGRQSSFASPPLLGRQSSVSRKRARGDRACTFTGGEIVGNCPQQLDEKACTYYVVSMIVDDLFPQKDEHFATLVEMWKRAGGFSAMEKTIRNYNLQVASVVAKPHRLVLDEVLSAPPDAIEEGYFYVLSFYAENAGSHVVYLQKITHESSGTFFVICDPWCGKKIRIERSNVEAWDALSVYRIRHHAGVLSTRSSVSPPTSETLDKKGTFAM
jgi:hypothetical protein